MRNFQVAIVGGGVIGSAIAWELSKYNINVVVFEKGSDVASGTSKANSGVIHSGINSAPDSLKAFYCVKGNQMLHSISKKIGLEVKWIGKYVIAKDERELNELKRLKKVGIKNNVPDLKIVNSDKVNEKNVNCKSALWVPTAGIVSPYEFTIALAENAAENNVKFLLETQVKNIKKTSNNFIISTNKGEYKSDILVNAAGLNCKDIVSMVEEPDFNVYPCRGEYLVLDKNYSSLVNSMIYPVPVKELGVLGVHITPTIEGNIILGPSAEFIEDPDDKKTTKNMMKSLLEEAKEIIPKIPDKAVINAYSGVRCKLASEKEGGWADFRIQESKKNPNMINLLGIESPGLTAAPAIAEDIKKMISKKIKIKPKQKFKTAEPKMKRFQDMTKKQQTELIKKDQRWGRIVCRCEHITEAEVIKALKNPIGAKTLSAVKYRCRAGMGRCQGGFCTQHIVRIMEEQFKINFKNITLKSPESNIFYRRNREEKQ